MVPAASPLHPANPHPITVPPPAPRRHTDRGGEEPPRRATSVPFTQVPTAVLRAADLPPSTRLLYSLLCAYQGQATTCWPPQARLAQHLSPTTTVRTVQRLLRPLRDKGWITVQRVGTRQVYTCGVALPPGGFVQIPTCVLKAAHLSTGARLLYALLLSYRGRAGTYPGQTRLAADLGVTSTRTVRRLLTELATGGYLTWTRAGRGQANRYHLHIPASAPPPAERTLRSPTTTRPSTLNTTAVSAREATPVSTEPDAREPDTTRTIFSIGATAHSSEKPSDPVRQHLRAYVADLARELGDDAPLAASLSRACNLFVGSGLPLDVFLARFQEARRVTQGRTAQVQKQRQAASAKNKMPYFFAVLAERLAGTVPQADSLPPPRADLVPPVNAVAVAAHRRVRLVERPRSPGRPHIAARTPRTPHQGRPIGRSLLQEGASPAPMPHPAAVPSTPPPPAPIAPAPAAPSYSPLIAGAVLDLAGTLHDPLAGPGAVPRALALWQQSGWSEGSFVAALHREGATGRRRRLDEVLHALAARVVASDLPDVPGCGAV